MKAEQLNEDLDAYVNVFDNFVAQYQLPAEWFSHPDHFAIKCSDTQDFEETVESVRESLEPTEFWQIVLDGRRLASAKFSGSITVSSRTQSSVSWVEVMEPRPGKSSGSPFVEHVEYTYPDFHEVMRILGIRGFDNFELQGNQGHSWVNLVIDEELGREIKINDRPLYKVIEFENENGLLSSILDPRSGLGAKIIPFPNRGDK